MINDYIIANTLNENNNLCCPLTGVELVGRNKREMSGNVLNYFYALGEAAVGLFAWLYGDWVTVQLLVSAPPLLFVLYYWYI